MQTTYQQKCELNYEYDAIKKFFNFFSEGEDAQGDLFIIAATFRESNEDQEQFEEEMDAIEQLKNVVEANFVSVNEQIKQIV